MPRNSLATWTQIRKSATAIERSGVVQHRFDDAFAFLEISHVKDLLGSYAAELLGTAQVRPNPTDGPSASFAHRERAADPDHASTPWPSTSACRSATFAGWCSSGASPMSSGGTYFASTSTTSTRGSPTCASLPPTIPPPGGGGEA